MPQVLKETVEEDEVAPHERVQQQERSSTQRMDIPVISVMEEIAPVVNEPRRREWTSKGLRSCRKLRQLHKKNESRCRGIISRCLRRKS